MKWVEFAKGDGYKESLDYYKHGYEFCLDGTCIFLNLTHTTKNGAYRGKKRVGASPEITRYVNVHCPLPFKELEYSLSFDNVIIGDIVVNKNKFFLAIRGIGDDRQYASIAVVNMSLFIRYGTRIAVLKGRRLGAIR